MNLKNKRLTTQWLIAATLLAVTPTLEASFSGVAADISIKGDNIALISQSTQGAIFVQYSTDKGTTWSARQQLTGGGEFFTQNVFPRVAIGGSNPDAPVVYSFANPSTGIDGIVGWNIFYFNPISEDPAGGDFLLSKGVSILGLDGVQDIVFVSNAVGQLIGIPPRQIVNLYVVPSNPNNIITAQNNNQSLPTSGNPPALVAGSLTSSPPSALVVTIPLRKTKTNPTPPSSTLFIQQTPTQWVSTTQDGVIPGFENLLDTSRIELVASEDLSKGVVMWLYQNQLFSNLFTHPSIWSDAIPLNNDPIRLFGGVSFDPTTGGIQTLCSTMKGAALFAAGTLDTGLTASVIQSFPNKIRQISQSNTRGPLGFWLVLYDDASSKGQISLLRGNFAALTGGTTLVQNLTDIKDHNTAMAITVDEVTGDVASVFNISSPTATFFGRQVTYAPGVNTDIPGTYVCITNHSFADITIQKIGPMIKTQRR